MSTPFSLQRVHWRQPSLIFGGFVIGIAAAIGHHFFNLRHDGHIVGEDDGEQEWVHRIGTGLAFLVRACFSISLGTALVQCFWDRLESNYKAASMRTVDHAFEIVVNPFGIFDIGFWVYSPSMVLFAIIYWLLPLAIIPAPSSLIVSVGEAQQSSLFARVPLVDLGSSLLYHNSSNSYQSPSNLLKRHALATAFSGSIANISPIYQSYSYDLSFYGPSIRCHPFPVDPFWTRPRTKVGIRPDGVPIQYYASAPLNHSIDFVDQIKNLETVGVYSGSQIYLPNAATGGNPYFKYLDLDPKDAKTDGTRLYIIGIKESGYSLLDWQAGRAASECRLYNSSYKVEFIFKNQQQEVKVLDDIILNEVTALGSREKDDSIDSGVESIWGYQAIMETVGYVVAGWLEGETSDPLALEGPTNMLSTTLVDTLDFELYPENLAWSAEIIPNAPNRTFVYGVEQLMRNITLGLFSREEFLLSNAESQEVNVNIRASTATYKYNSRSLLLAYVISGSLTVAGCFLGLIAIIRAGRSFSNNLSTVIRTSRNEKLDHLVKFTDTDGADPPSDYLAKAKIKLVPIHGHIATDGEIFAIDVVESWTGKTAGMSERWLGRRREPSNEQPTQARSNNIVHGSTLVPKDKQGTENDVIPTKEGAQIYDQPTIHRQDRHRNEAS